MKTIKNISKTIAVTAIFIGFIAGSFAPGAQSGSCCGMAVNSCCCSADLTAQADSQSTTYNQRCGCGISENNPPANTELNAQFSTELQNNIDITNTDPIRSKLSYGFKSVNHIKVESVRNSGPPKYLVCCSFLI